MKKEITVTLEKPEDIASILYQLEAACSEIGRHPDTPKPKELIGGVYSSKWVVAAKLFNAWAGQAKMNSMHSPTPENATIPKKHRITPI